MSKSLEGCQMMYVSCRPGIARLRRALRTACWVTGLPPSTGLLSSNAISLTAKPDSTNWIQCSSVQRSMGNTLQLSS